MHELLNIIVPGIPAPGGSKRALWRPGTKHANIVDAGGERTKNWRAVVALAARSAYRETPDTGPLSLRLMFFMPRPKSHYRSNGELKPNAPYLHVKKPDTTKLIRSTEDALTGIVWQDDSQIAHQQADKVYGESPGCRVVVTLLEDIRPTELRETAVAPVRPPAKSEA